MLFNANINSAVAFSGDSKTGDMVKQLEKMLKDEKNEDFKDQIYFALANIFRKKGDMVTAKKYYTLSSAVSRTNKNQKAVSCLALADIYFIEPQYKFAQAYYDSTIMNLDKNYANYEAVFLKTKNLTALVNNLTTISLQDSLQRVARLSEKERLLLIDQRIQQYKAEQAKKNAPQGTQRDPIFDEDVNRVNANQSSLPFYNPGTLARSMDMFKRKWGDRKLEDNWRRKNKAIVMETTEDVVADNNNTNSDEAFTQEDREFYLAQLPLTDSLINISTEKIEKAYFAAGEIYMEKLNDYNEAIAVFEQYIKRFPKGKFVLDTYYYLYKMNIDLENKTQADVYKNLIIKEFPNSTHAILFTNPNYLSQMKSEKNKVDEVYKQAFDNYKNKNYSQAINLSSNANQTFPNNYLEPKFDFLIALSKGALAAPNPEILQTELRNIVAKHPKSDEATKADQMLKALSENSNGNQNKAIDIYSNKPSRTYLYVLILRNSFNLNRIEFDIAKFNINNFPTTDFSVTTKDLLKSEKMLIVQGISNLEQIKEYFTKIKQDKEVRKDLTMENYDEFIISQENFNVFETDKNAKLYIQFMNELMLK
jgi:TolA-binding protein